MDRREELLGWIEKTRRLQRTMAVVFGVLAIVAVGLAVWNGTVGTFAFILLALVALCSFWVTAAHNAAHHQKLDELARNDGKPLRTAHRRWHT